MTAEHFFTKAIMGELSDTKLTALNLFGPHLVLGEITGKLTSHEISSKNRLIQCKTIDKQKGKIDRILTLPDRNISFVLLSGEIHIFTIPLLQEKNTFKLKENIEKIYMNKLDKEGQGKLLCITKKKKVKICEFDPSTNTLSEKRRDKEIYIDDIPSCGVWVGNKFVYAYGKSVAWLDLETGKSSPIEYEGTLQLINFGKVIGLVRKEMTLFMEDGKAYSMNPIIHTEPDFIHYVEYKNYLIGLYKESISVLKKNEKNYDPVETLKFDKSDGFGKFIIASYDKIIIANENQTGGSCNILSLKERPYEEQIEVLIKNKQFNNALEKLVENVSELDQEKNKKIEKFFLDCAWSCVNSKPKNLDLALKYFSLTNFNPFEIIYMFYNFLSVNIIHLDKKDNIINDRENNQLLSLNPEENEIKKVLPFLVNILIAKRDYILENFKSTEDKYKNITFLSSKFGKIRLDDSSTDINVSQTLDSINSALIKSAIKLKKKPKEIEIILDNNSINFSIFDDLDNDQFFQDPKNKELNETKFTKAYIAEKKGDYETALEAWKNFGYIKNDSNNQFGLFIFEARDRTKKIFYKFKDTKSTDRARKENLFTTYIKWLLKKVPEEAFEIAIKTELVGIRKFMDEIIPDVEKDNDSDTKMEPGALKEKFLEYCNQNQQTENYQTQLLELYAEKMFSIVKKDEPKLTLNLEGELKKTYEGFMKILKDPNSCYNKKAVLDFVEKSWLKEATIFLYSQLKEHDKALDELFKNAKLNNSFKEIEDYCIQNLSSKPDIFQKFYELLSIIVNKDCQGNIDKNNDQIEKFETKISTSSTDYVTETEKNELKKKIQNLKEENKKFEDLKKPYENEMLKILRDFGSIENLDPLFALNYADEHWNVCGNLDFFNYLSNVIKEYTVEGNKYKIGKNLSEMGLIYKEKEALDYKKKYVTIDSDKTCDLCKKKIGNTIFVVYPNLKVYHVKCAANPNIDPMTGVDFSKKKFA